MQHRELKLPDGSVVLFDEEYYNRFRHLPWRVHPKGGVVVHNGAGEVHSEFVFMHHIVMPKVDGFVVDHRNRNKQDNRRSNLRYATVQQNAANMRRRDGLKGVTPQRGKWKAQIMVNGKNKYLGLHPTAEDAARAYDQAAREAFGQFACCNFEVES